MLSTFGEPEKRTIKIALATCATTILLRINPSKKLQKTTKSYKNWSHKLHLQKHWPLHQRFYCPTIFTIKKLCHRKRKHFHRKHFRKHSENVPKTFRKHSENISENISKTFRKHSAENISTALHWDCWQFPAHRLWKPQFQRDQLSSLSALKTSVSTDTYKITKTNKNKNKNKQKQTKTKTNKQ